jgi:hypothetical protein
MRSQPGSAERATNRRADSHRLLEHVISQKRRGMARDARPVPFSSCAARKNQSRRCNSDASIADKVSV